jgi:hypothetical protein
VTLASSHPNASFGQEITFTATITAPTGATGTMTFKMGNSNIPGCVDLPVTAAQAQCVVSGLMPGSYNISVIYSGDATTLGLQPPPIVQLVDLIYFYLPLVGK